MAERASKRARGDKLATLKTRLPYISQTALAAVLKAVKGGEFPSDCTDRKTLRKSKESYVAQSGTYGPLHQRVNITDSMST